MEYMVPAPSQGIPPWHVQDVQDKFGEFDLPEVLLLHLFCPRASGLARSPGELQSPTQRGQVHVFGQRSPANSIHLRRKMDQTPDFAVLLIDSVLDLLFGGKQRYKVAASTPNRSKGIDYET